MVTKIQLAAMSRANIPAEQRTPFYLYVDEFQNFATDSFATILSEARKYGLNLTVANQYIAQMPIEVKDAVFGNVGSIVSFRMSADDARTMLRYFEPKFTEYDLVHMHNRHFVISMTIEGEKVPAYSAVTLNLPVPQVDETEHIIQHSRDLYASSKAYVEHFVGERYLLDTTKPSGSPTVNTPPVAQSPRPLTSVSSPSIQSQPTFDQTPQATDQLRPKRRRPRHRHRQGSVAEAGQKSDNALHELNSDSVINLK
jgi:hypothetical protein